MSVTFDYYKNERHQASRASTEWNGRVCEFCMNNTGAVDVERKDLLLVTEKFKYLWPVHGGKVKCAILVPRLHNRDLCISGLNLYVACHMCYTPSPSLSRANSCARLMASGMLVVFVPLAWADTSLPPPRPPSSGVTCCTHALAFRPLCTAPSAT